MTIINTNISAMIGLNNLRLTNLGLRTSLERLSSGLQINKAADNPSGLAIAESMAAQIGGTRVAIQNAEDGVNLIHTVDGSLAETQDMLLRMRDLAVRASNEATLTSADLGRLDNEMASLKAEIERKSHAVTFNTKVMFSGLYSGGGANGLVLQIGADNGALLRLTINIPNLGVSSLLLSAGTAAQAISSNRANLNAVTSAQFAIDQVQSAINQISDLRANLGIQERRIYSVIDDLNTTEINITAAKSRIMDADMAKEISEFTRLQILQQSGTAILAQANAQPQSILQLFQ